MDLVFSTFGLFGFFSDLTPLLVEGLLIFLRVFRIEDCAGGTDGVFLMPSGHHFSNDKAGALAKDGTASSTESQRSNTR